MHAYYLSSIAHSYIKNSTVTSTAPPPKRKRSEEERRGEEKREENRGKETTNRLTTHSVIQIIIQTCTDLHFLHLPTFVH